MKKFISVLTVFVLLLSGITSPLKSEAKEFYYEEMADMLNAMDILHGDGTGYNFGGMLTRAQFTKLAIAASPYKNSVPAGTNTSPFSDVRYSHWAAGYIKVAVANSVIAGYPDSTFKPENYVKTEEAVTVLLKMLGYTNADFGGEWPYGQMGIANNIGLLDNVYTPVGANLTRRDAIAMIYNMTGLNSKDGGLYLSKLGYSRTDDVVIIASSKEDTTIDSNKVYTSAGLFKVSSSFDFKNVGRTGDMIVKQSNNEIVGFYPITQSVATYSVNSVQGEDIWLSGGGETKLLTAQNNTTVYEKTSKTSLSSVFSQIEEGDEITVITNADGYISYLLLKYKDTAAFGSTVSESYVVSAKLGTTIIVSDNGSNKALNISADTTAYFDSAKTSYNSLVSQISTGDVITVVKDGAGKIRYVSADTGTLDGPYTANGSSVFATYGISSDATVLKGGSKVSESEISVNDIIYYSKSLNTVWVYSDRKTGIYESASPNNDIPTSITLSGQSYNIESAAAFSKLASGGKYAYGTTVTLLLGRNGEIADVVSPSATDTVYAFVLSAGKSVYKNNSGMEYSSYNVTVLTPDGQTYEYATERDYSSCVNKVAKIDFRNTGAVLSVYESNGDISGNVDATGYKIGKSRISKYVNIIDLTKRTNNSVAGYAKTYLSRIDGIHLPSTQILYAGKNAQGEIDSLILENVTGDAYSYGIIISNNLGGSDRNISSNGSYILNGKTYNFSGGFTIKGNTPVRLSLSGNTIQSVDELSMANGMVTSVKDSSVVTGTKETYQLSDKVEVYTYSLSLGYMLTTIDELKENLEDYSSVRAYCDDMAAGGRVRIIIAKK